MRLHVCRLMYSSLQATRYPNPHTYGMLRLLATALDLVEERGTYLLPADALDPIAPPLQPFLEFDYCEDDTPAVVLDASSEPLHSLVKIATLDLLRLESSEWDEELLHAVGYALHNIPEFIPEPARFDRGYFWGDVILLMRVSPRLTSEVRAALARVVGLDRDEFERILAGPEPWTWKPPDGNGAANA